MSVRLRLEEPNGEAILRNLSVPIQSSYPDLLAAAQRSLPPGTGPIALRFVDHEGELLTINSRRDIALAMQTTVKRMAREAESDAAGLVRLPQSGLPPLAISAVRCAKSPAGCEEEGGGEAVAGSGDNVIEIDEWLLDLSAEFRTRLGLAEDAEVDVASLSADACAEALDSAVLDPACEHIFAAAVSKFREAAALALFNAGNVHSSQARKAMDAAVTSAALAAKAAHAAALGAEALSGFVPAPVALMEAAVERATGKSVAMFDSHLDKAAACWARAAEVRPGFVDPAIAWGQQLFERAKIVSLRAKDDPGVSATDVDAAFERAVEKFDETAADLGRGGEEEATQRSNLAILAGNVLFEQSNVSHARGDGRPVWEGLAEAAVARFRGARCAEEDIVRALKGHPSGAWAG
jgi:hypothetical protein